MNRKLCSLVLAFVLLLSSMPLTAAAEQGTDVCTYHTVHTEECGYQEAAEEIACGHVCGQACGYHCVHPEHTQECYGMEEDGVTPSQEASSCSHRECSVESGCISAAAQCIHTDHDELCGYQAATEEQPCQHSCEFCSVETEEEVLLVTSQEGITNSASEASEITISFPDFEEHSFAVNEWTCFYVTYAGIDVFQPISAVYEVFDAETQVSTGVTWEDEEMLGVAEYTPAFAGTYYIQATLTFNGWTQATQRTPVFSVSGGIQPVTIYLNCNSSNIVSPGEYVGIQTDTIGQGTVSSIVYDFIDEATGMVTLSYTLEAFDDNYYCSCPMQAGTYLCKVTLTNALGERFVMFSEEKLTVMDYVRINDLYLSQNALSLGDSFQVTAETIGQGTCSFLYEVYQEQGDDVVSIHETTSDSPEFIYTPEAAGTYYVCVTCTSGENNSWQETGYITVHEGLWLKKLHLAGRDSSHCILQAVTEGVGRIQSLVFQVVDIETGEPVGDPQEGSSSIFHFPIPENAKDSYRCQATLTDEAGNVTVGEVDFEVFSNRLRILHILQSSDSYDYQPGETIAFTVETYGEGTISNLRYEIYDSSSSPYRLITAHDNTTDTTYSYLPEQCGVYYVEVILTDAEGNTDTDYTGFTVTDAGFAFTGLTVTPATVAPGETVSFSCQVSDPDKVASVYCQSYASGTGYFNIYKGTELTWSYTPHSYLSFSPIYVTVDIATTDGSVYTQYASINITDADKCLINYARATERTIKLGDPVTIDVSLGGSKKFQSLTYRIVNEEDGSEEVFVSTESQLTYIPKKIGTHTVALSMTQTNGNITNYDSSLLKFLVTTVYPDDSANHGYVEFAYGESFTYQIPLVGDGAVEYVQYTIRGSQWDGTSIDPIVYEGTETSYTFHPEVAGSYRASAILINADGFTFQPSLPQLIVYDGIFLTGLAASSETLCLGESVIFTPAYQGSGEIEELYYYITWYGLSLEDQPMSVKIPASLDPFTWTPDKEGSYSIELRLNSKTGYQSFAETSIVVEKSNIQRPTQQPEGSSADLTKLESGSLDAEAAAWADAGTQAEISLSSSYVQPQAGDPEQALLKEALGDKDYELLDISVNKTENGETTQLTETKTVLELKIPFRYQGKTEVSINRIHNGVCQTLWRLPSRPSSPADGTFYADVENSYLYIYSSQYCLFSISYKAAPTGTTAQPPAETAPAAAQWTAASDNPPTGDAICLPIITMLSTGAVLLYLFTRRKYTF